MIRCGIYALMNRRTGRWYGGQSVDIPRRIRQHLSSLRRRCNPCAPLQAEYDRDGRDAFVAVVLEACIPERLDAREQAYLDAGFAADVVYNSATRAGWPPKGHRWTTESRSRRSKAQREMLAHPAGRAAFDAGMAKRGEPWREKTAARGKAWRSDRVAVEHHDRAMARRSLDPAWRQTMRERNARLAADPTWRANVAAAHATDSARANHGAATKRFWEALKADPAAYAAMREKIRAGRRRRA
jgi:group I intron endonuclease